MAKVKIHGFDAYTERLNLLSDQAVAIAEAGVYAGANVVADAIRAGLEGIPIDEHWGTPEEPLRGLRPAQKWALLSYFGIAPIQNDGGYINVKLGFDGYNNLRSRRWPNGQPNAMIMRAVESGTSFMVKNPVIKQALAKTKNQRSAAMSQAVEREINRIMEG